MCGQGDHPPYDDEPIIAGPRTITVEGIDPPLRNGGRIRDWPIYKGPDHPLRSPWVERALDGTLPAPTIAPVRKGAHL